MTQFWTAQRPGWTAAWVDHYWQSGSDPQRDVIVEVLSTLPRFRTVLEVGSHCGPNLRRVAEAFSDVQCVGIDANQDAVDEGNRRLTDESLSRRVRLVQGVFPESTQSWPARQADVVLTCFLLAYIAPAELTGAIRELQRLSSRFVVCMEPHGQNMRVQSNESHAYVQHDYDAAFRGAEQGRWWRYAVEPSVSQMNSVSVWARIG